MTLVELLNDLSADREKYNIPLVDSARYAIRSIVEAGDGSYFPALPEDVRLVILEMVDSFKRQGRLIFLSNLGEEDATDVMQKFLLLCDI